MEKSRLNTGQKIVLVVTGIGIAFIVLYIIRDKSKAFRDAMDEYIPINPFNLTNIILKADQEKYVKDLHPTHQNQFRAFIKECEDNGWTIIVTSGYRDFASQLKQHLANKNNARPGKSHHNYGLAMDINAIRPGIALRKASSEKAWVESGIPDIAKKHGLSWQYRFGSYVDPVHFFIKYDTSKLFTKALAQAGGDEMKIQGNRVKLT